MCGIGGILFSQDKKEIIKKKITVLNTLQRHRGPDEQNILVLDQHAFCHQRLILLDAKNGQQPLWDSSRRYLVVYNGELYNYLELKQELENQYHFETSSDTEVVLAAYILWGESCLHRFNGMFAFLIWDTLTKTAFAARDPLGVKPFVYCMHGSTFTFASELKALIKILDRACDIDPFKLAEYLIAPSLSGAGSTAIFKNIRYLEPGTAMRISAQGIKIDRYFQFQWKATGLTEEELVNSIGCALEHSVQISLRADVPIGLFLSGGLDSSLIASIAKKYAKEPQKAFSIAFENHSEIHFDPATIVNSDDLPFAKDLAERLSLPFYQVTADHSSFANSMQQLAIINDRIPAWEQEFSQHFLSRTASGHVKAILVGDAADETHYGYFFLLNEATNHSPLGLTNLFGGQKRIGLLSTKLQNEIQPMQYLDAQYRLLAAEAGFDFNKGGQERILAMSTLIHRRWLERLLHNGDIHTMHFGLEARVPFANRNLLDIACQVYPHNGFKNSVEKFILRQIGVKWLSPQFYNRKKSALPRDPRLGKNYQSILFALLQEKNDFIDTFLHRSAIHALCIQNTVCEADRMILFNLICLIFWANHYAK